MEKLVSKPSGNLDPVVANLAIVYPKIAGGAVLEPEHDFHGAA